MASALIIFTNLLFVVPILKKKKKIRKAFFVDKSFFYENFFVLISLGIYPAKIVYKNKTGFHLN